MTSACLLERSWLLKLSWVRCTTSDGISDQFGSGGGAGGGSLGSLRNSTILLISRRLGVSKANSPSLKYLIVGNPFTWKKKNLFRKQYNYSMHAGHWCVLVWIAHAILITWILNTVNEIVFLNIVLNQ